MLELGKDTHPNSVARFFSGRAPVLFSSCMLPAACFWHEDAMMIITLPVEILSSKVGYEAPKF